ncbi:MAG: 50S ribosomal protein L29 [Candidatus Calescibacterium sp.]|jgi:large subunit ribosomal protein L29
MSKRTEQLEMLRKMSDTELISRLAELKKELFALRAAIKIEGRGNSARIKKTKKEIARILTILRER